MEFSELKKMPHSVEAEQCVIGSVLIDPECISAIADKLRPDYFYVDKYSKIYELMLDMFLDNQNIDFVTVLEQVKARGIYDETEGKKLLFEMTQLVPSTKNILEYANIILEKANLRRLIEACDDITEACYLQNESTVDILDMAEQRIYEIMQSRTNTSLVHIKSAVLESYDKLHKLSKDKNAFLGIQTKFKEIDHMLSGLGKSDLILIAARPGIGKTSFALNIAQNIGLDKPKKSIAVFSLEMSNDQLANRMLSAQSGVDNTKFRTGELSEDEWIKVARAATVLSDTEIYFDDTAGVTVAQMKAKLRRLKKLDLIIIDYLQLMSGGARHENRVQEVSAISRSLQIMAKEFNVPVITLSQLSRETEKRRGQPILSDLRESGAIEQDADVVMFLWRPDEYDENEPSDEVECIVAKNRHGPTGKVKLGWSASTTRFANIKK